MFVGVVALRYQHYTTLGSVVNEVTQLHTTQSAPYHATYFRYSLPLVIEVT